MALSRRTGQRFQASIWPGFVDAMTALLLVLMFVLTIFMVVQSMLRDTITGQDKALERLHGEIAELADALGLEQQRAFRLEQQAGVLAASLEQAQSDNATKEALIATLTAQVGRQERALREAATRIDDFEARVAALLAERDSARTAGRALAGELDTLKAAQADLMSRKEALELALATARKEISAEQEAARLAAARRAALEALIADLRRRSAQQKEQLNAVETARAALATELSEAEKARLTEAAAAEALREKLKNADAELTAMTLALEEERRRAEETLTLLAAAEAAQEKLNEKLAAAVAAAAAARSDLDEAGARAGSLEDQLADTRAKLAKAQAELAALGDVAVDREKVREQLAAALAAQQVAEQRAEQSLGEARKQAALLSAAREALTEEQAQSAESRRRIALLNQQIAALRRQLGALQAVLDEAEARDAAARVQIEALGSRLNAALARAASETRRRLALEEAERKRLEEEARRLAAEKQDLERYRSEFFGRLRDVLGNQEGVRIEGDRFVFSSEVLFEPASVELSEAGKREIAKVAAILRKIADRIPPEIDWIIRVDGHTDNTPLSGSGRYRDNWELSQGRALSVVRYMISEFGIPPERLAASGFGEYQPVDPADTPEARAKNRRIELKLTER